MPLFGTVTAFLAAVFADLKGNGKTRPFTRGGFGSIVLLDAGVTLSGVASFAGDVVGAIAGAV